MTTFYFIRHGQKEAGGAAHVASKAAIVGITRHTALRFAGTKIRCNAVCLGTIVTPMVAGMNAANMDTDMFNNIPCTVLGAWDIIIERFR